MPAAFLIIEQMKRLMNSAMNLIETVLCKELGSIERDFYTKRALSKEGLT